MQLFSVEHQFEIIVEDIRGLSVFGNTVWGETDCFVQYHFPFQRLQQLMQLTGQGVKALLSDKSFDILCG